MIEEVKAKQVSKELIESVLNVKVEKVVESGDIETISWIPDVVLKVGNGASIVSKGRAKKDMDIDKFMTKCKNWAIEKDYFLETRFIKDYTKWRCVIHYEDNGTEQTIVDIIPLEDTEAEAVIEACQWILEESNPKA